MNLRRPNRGPTGLYLVKVGAATIVVAKTSVGYVGFSQLCPHEARKLNVTGTAKEDDLFCQAHGVHYSLDSGEATHNPTPEDPGTLNLIKVDRDGDNFIISIAGA